MYSNRLWDVCLRKLQAPSIIKATATHELCPQHTLPLDYRGAEVTMSPPKDGHLFSPQSLVATVELDSSFLVVLCNRGEALVRKVSMSLASPIPSPLVREEEFSLGHFYLNMAVFSGCRFLRGQI